MEFRITNEKESEEEVAEQYAMNLVAKRLLLLTTEPETFKRTRKIKDYNSQFWQSECGKLLQHPNINYPRTTEGKRFRRRFRLPYPLFQYLVEICIRYNIFDLTNASPIPIELKILACLRILGRNNCADDVTELSHEILGEATVRFLFKTFVTNMAERVSPKFIKLAKGKQLAKVLDTFAKIGLPGCVGSMDCTRVKWSMCPARQRWSHIGIYISMLLLFIE